jgi:hypothetical protein
VRPQINPNDQYLPSFVIADADNKARRPRLARRAQARLAQR